MFQALLVLFFLQTYLMVCNSKGFLDFFVCLFQNSSNIHCWGKVRTAVRPVQSPFHPQSCVLNVVQYRLVENDIIVKAK